MNAVKKWEFSTIRDMQNRIRLLEMDSELTKSQMLSYSHDIRQAFMDMAERIDRLETKLAHLIHFEKSQTSTNTMFPLFHLPNVEAADATEHMHGFDAMSCVETVMEATCDNRHTLSNFADKKISRTIIKSIKDMDQSRKKCMNNQANVSLRHPKPFTIDKDGRRRYDCVVCGKSFSQSSGLSRHHKIHLRKQQNSQNALHSDGFPRPKRFFCGHAGCNSSFTSRSGMTKHTKHFHRDNRNASATGGSKNLNSVIAASSCLALPVEKMDVRNGSVNSDDTAFSDEGTSQDMSPSRDTISDDELEQSPGRME